MSYKKSSNSYRRSSGRRRVAALLVGAGSAAGLALAAPGAASAATSPTVNCTQGTTTATCTYTYSYTGASQQFTPPSGVASITYALSGGGGGTGGQYNGLGGKGGEGASVSGSLGGLTPSTTLNVYVGGRGSDGKYNTVAGAGGYGYGSGGTGGSVSANNLYASGGGGGGASALLTGSTPVAIAAGGAGGGGGGAFGSTGGPGGASGANGSTGSLGGNNGGTAGGETGHDGGAGQAPVLSGGGGGGGGGGQHGGTGGKNGGNFENTPGGGGGGGSSQVPAGGSLSNGVNSGDGQVTISFTVPKLAITTSSLPPATGGHSYSTTLAATGGVPPYSWSVTGGNLPPGLNLDSSTGVISGTPDQTGPYGFSVTVTDSENPAATATKTFTIKVSGPVIFGVTPDRGPIFGGTVVRISGSGLACKPFQPCKVTVSFGSNPVSRIAFDSPTTIFVSAPPSQSTGTVDVTVTVGGVHNQDTSADHFTYEPIR
jgi:hypothetical protein